MPATRDAEDIAQRALALLEKTDAGRARCACSASASTTWSIRTTRGRTDGDASLPFAVAVEVTRRRVLRAAAVGSARLRGALPARCVAGSAAALRGRAARRHAAACAARRPAARGRSAAPAAAAPRRRSPAATSSSCTPARLDDVRLRWNATSRVQDSIRRRSAVTTARLATRCLAPGSRGSSASLNVTAIVVGIHRQRPASARRRGGLHDVAREEPHHALAVALHPEQAVALAGAEQIARGCRSRTCARRTSDRRSRRNCFTWRMYIGQRGGFCADSEQPAHFADAVRGARRHRVWPPAADVARLRRPGRLAGASRRTCLVDVARRRRRPRSARRGRCGHDSRSVTWPAAASFSAKSRKLLTP